MPFGADGEHVTVQLVDLEDVERNQYVVSTQYTVRSGANERRADLVLLVNGLPLVVIEAKTLVRSSQSWFDGATQIHDDYERNVPELFVPNLCSVATEGKDLRYGSIGLPVDLWGPWRADDDADTPKLERIKRFAASTCWYRRLTGFDAPILQAMYLDKPLRDHTLLQAICRTNRPYGETKTRGLIVNYLGILDDVAQAIQFDEEGITRVVTNINELVAELPAAVQKQTPARSALSRARRASRRVAAEA